MEQVCFLDGSNSPAAVTMDDQKIKDSSSSHSPGTLTFDISN